jgi:two-component system phosphate regulon response regulator OmpR
MTAQHLLVVDDDARLRSLLVRSLSGQGYLVSNAANADEAEALLAVLRFDLIVLDVMMPGRSGLELAAALRPQLTTPILLLTALGEAEDRIRGLEAGADDYLAKPFAPRELHLRIQAILRRSGAAHAPAQIVLGPFRFDPATQRLEHDGAPVPLTGMEQALLTALAARLNAPVAREELARMLGVTADVDSRALDVQILRLRRRLGEDANLIVTVRGKGYMLQGGVA